jgi:hypothetical protein
MPKKTSNHKIFNDNHRSIPPVQELRFLDAVMSDHDLSMTAKVVAFFLVRWTQGDEAHRFNGYAWASREALADRIGRDSTTTITTATNALKARGWIIAKRRPNATNLMRPNWNRASQILADAGVPRQEVPSVDQKFVSPEHQFPKHPEVQKTGPDSTDQDSAYQDSDIIPERLASGTLDVDSRASACDAGQRSVPGRSAGYGQSKAEADRALKELRSMPWRKEWDDPSFKPSPDASKAEAVHWHKLLKAGISASRVERAASRFLSRVPENQHPSLARFLARYAWDCIEIDCDLYVPPDDERLVAANENDLSIKRKFGR